MIAPPCPRCGLFHPAGAPCLALRTPEVAAREAPLAPGVTMGGYRIVRTLHRGGTSVVYLAEDTRVKGRQVALKELRPDPSCSTEERAEAESWFAREAALLSTLREPRIPAFYSAFHEDGHSYIAQDYVPGENLDDMVRRQGPLPEEKVLEWGRALAGLLRYLHGRPEPVVFRDLKPANILLRTDGRLVVVDFGIARPVAREGSRLLPGTVIGTPGYAPPEQYQGLADERSDIYALGATLHRLLTGYEPEQGPPHSFPPVRELNPGVSGAMAAVVERAVRLAAAARYPTAAAMRADLDSLAGRRRGRRRIEGFRRAGVAALAPTLLLAGLALRSMIAPHVPHQAATAISAGQENGCAVTRASKLICWGDSDEWIVETPPGLTAVRAVSVGWSQACALTGGGSLTCWSGSGQPAVELVDISQVSAGDLHACALRRKGTVTCWGGNQYGESSVPVGLKDVRQVSAGDSHTCALRSNGSVVCWGMPFDGERAALAGLRHVRQISVGEFYACAVLRDATVRCWGSGSGSGEAHPPPGLGDVSQISAGKEYTCALTGGGVTCWGGLRHTPVPPELAADS